MKKTCLFLALALLVPSARAGADTIVATVAGAGISLAEAEARVRTQLTEIDNARYDALRGGIDAIIAERLTALEAKSRGTTVGELRKVEVDAKVGKPTDEQVQEVYDANKARLHGAPLDAVRSEIVQFLEQQLTGARMADFLSELRGKYETVVLLDPPVADVGTGGRQGRGGGKDAPITIIGFSDYECPYCKAAEGTIKRIREKYGDTVNYVHRDYPLPFHANAHEAAEAARCAGDQDRFWDYHDGLFESESLSTDALRQLASRLVLDRDAFDECLSSGRFKEAVNMDLRAGEKVGVNGTPAFFVNGRMLSGAQSVEAFERVIEEELARVARAAE